MANETIDGWVIDNIIANAADIGLKGVIFDHRCNLNTTQLIEAMKKLKQAQLHVSYHVVTSDIYNNPSIKKALDATLITAKDFYHHPSIKPALHDKMMADAHFYHKVNKTAQQTLNYPIPTIENFYYPPNREQRLYDKIMSTKYFYHRLNNASRQALLDNLIAAGDYYPPANTTEQALIDKMITDKHFYYHLNTLAQQPLSDRTITAEDRSAHPRLYDKMITDAHFYYDLNTLAQQPLSGRMVTAEDRSAHPRLYDKMITDKHFYYHLNTLAQQPLNGRMVTAQDRSARHYKAMPRLLMNKMAARNLFDNHFKLLAEAVLYDKMKAVIQSGQCDRFIHDYSDTAIWTKEARDEQITYVLRRIEQDLPAKKIILALELPVQQYEKEYTFFQKMHAFQFGRLLFWRHANIMSTRHDSKQPVFQSIYDHYANVTRERQEGKLTSALQQKIYWAIPKMENFLTFSAQGMSYNQGYYCIYLAQNRTLSLHEDGLLVIKEQEEEQEEEEEEEE